MKPHSTNFYSKLLCHLAVYVSICMRAQVNNSIGSLKELQRDWSEMTKPIQGPHAQRCNEFGLSERRAGTPNISNH